jgi:hypothetical protein
MRQEIAELHHQTEEGKTRGIKNQTTEKQKYQTNE